MKHRKLKKNNARARRQALVLGSSKFFRMTEAMHNLPRFIPATLNGLILERLNDFAKVHTYEDDCAFIRRELLRIELGA